MISIKGAFLLSLLVTSGLETMEARRLNREKFNKIKQGLGIGKAKEVVADSTEGEAKQEAQAEKLAAGSAEGEAEKATAEKAAAEKAAAEKAVAEKEAAEKEAAEKAAAVKAAAEKAAAEKDAAEREAPEKAAADKAVAEKAAAEKAAAKKAAAEKAEAEKAAVDKAAAEKAAAEKVAAEKAAPPRKRAKKEAKAEVDIWREECKPQCNYACHSAGNDCRNACHRGCKADVDIRTKKEGCNSPCKDVCEPEMNFRSVCLNACCPAFKTKAAAGKAGSKAGSKATARATAKTTNDPGRGKIITNDQAHKLGLAINKGQKEREISRTPRAQTLKEKTQAKNLADQLSNYADSHETLELKRFKEFFGAAAGKASKDFVFEMTCEREAFDIPPEFTIMYDDQPNNNYNPKCQDIGIKVVFTSKAGDVNPIGHMNKLCEDSSNGTYKGTRMFLRKVVSFKLVTDLDSEAAAQTHMCKRGKYTVQASEPVVMVDLEFKMSQVKAQKENKSKLCYVDPTMCKESKRGWTTDFCDLETGKCKKCGYPAYGKLCDEKCPQVCSEEVFFDSRPNGCNRVSGRCNACEHKFWGDSCENQCSENCFRGECDRNTARCGFCADGKWGEGCLNECDKNCYVRRPLLLGGIDSVEDARAGCPRNSGRCLSCKPGAHRVKDGDACEADEPRPRRPRTPEETRQIKESVNQSYADHHEATAEEAAAEKKAAKKAAAEKAAEKAAKKAAAEKAAAEKVAAEKAAAEEAAADKAASEEAAAETAAAEKAAKKAAAEKKAKAGNQKQLREAKAKMKDGKKDTSEEPKSGAIAKNGALGAIAVALVIAGAA